MTSFLRFSSLILILMAASLSAQPKLFRVEAEQFTDGSELTIHVYVTKIAGDDIPLGSANFSFFLTPAPLNIGGSFLAATGHGPFHSANTPGQYSPLEVRTNATFNIATLNVRSVTSSAGTGAFITSTRTLVGRAVVPITDPTGFNTFVWRTTGVGIQRFDGSSILANAEFVNPAPDFPLEPPTPLPVSILSFTGRWQPAAFKVAELTWEAQDVQTLESFQVERSTDLNTWALAGEVPTNNQYAGVFQFVDGSTAYLNQNRFYYRLLQQDLDGSSRFSNTVELLWPTGETAFRLYPNPARQAGGAQLQYLDGPSQAAVMQLVDLQGRTVSQNNINLEPQTIYQLELKGLAKGMYQVVITTESGFRTAMPIQVLD